jgi:hypothetical protein
MINTFELGKAFGGIIVIVILLWAGYSLGKRRYKHGIQNVEEQGNSPGGD